MDARIAPVDSPADQPGGAVAQGGGGASVCSPSTGEAARATEGGLTTTSSGPPPSGYGAPWFYCLCWSRLATDEHLFRRGPPQS
eukprot:8977048-Lingulodinium_polyedra.AAC.1